MTAIKVEEVSKKYSRGFRHTMLYGMRDIAKNALGISSGPERLRDGEFWALDRVSFEVKNGVAVGIIGPNGSGKSTLLKLLTGIFLPDKGRVVVNGRVGALLELGAGFHPLLTGRENIYVNGAILGMSKKEIDGKFQEIVEFAGVGDFLDAPLKHYSSGMYVRLGFSVAVHSEPQILIVDEVLAVGDAQFQARSFRKLEEFRKEGKTILFVSHSTEQIVRHCDRAILINGGKKLAEGEPREVANRYLDLVFGGEKKIKDLLIKVKDGGGSQFLNAENSTGGKSFPLKGESFKEAETGPLSNIEKDALTNFFSLNGESFTRRRSYSRNEYRWGDGRARIIDYLIISGGALNSGRADPVRCLSREPLEIYLKVKFNEDIRRPIYGLSLKTPDGVLIGGTNSRDWDRKFLCAPQKAGDIKIVRYSFTPRLNPGSYLFSVGVAEETAEGEVPLDRRYDSIELLFDNMSPSYGPVDLGLKFEAINRARFNL
jgi:lipopolysaccharide transport system ATP-binding protein